MLNLLTVHMYNTLQCSHVIYKLRKMLNNFALKLAVSILTPKEHFYSVTLYRNYEILVVWVETVCLTL